MSASIRARSRGEVVAVEAERDPRLVELIVVLDLLLSGAMTSKPSACEMSANSSFSSLIASGPGARLQPDHQPVTDERIEW